MKFGTRFVGALCAGLCFVAVPLAAAPATSTAPRQAPRLVHPEKAPIIAAATAAKRMVAVGDYGVVIISDGGAGFHQAAEVPTRAALTCVQFIDDRHGFAAGHDGTVLATDDGGEHWRLLRESRGEDKVLLSVWFENAAHGLAVGQFGLALETEDGGKTWSERRLVDSGEAAERHLLHIQPVKDGVVLVAAEAGTIFRSVDHGRHWTALQTDNKGSFWTGAVTADGSVLVAGLRGHIYRSTDHGGTWKEVASGTQQSLTGALARSDGSVRLVGMSGVSLVSRDGGQTFVATVRPDRQTITALAAGSHEVLFNLSGVLPDN